MAGFTLVIHSAGCIWYLDVESSLSGSESWGGGGGCKILFTSKFSAMLAL